MATSNVKTFFEDKIMNGLIAELEEERVRLSQNKDLIWHYTSADIGAQMLDRKTGLYATDYIFLNDSGEVYYGITRIKTFLDEMEKKPKDFLEAINYPDIDNMRTFPDPEIIERCREAVNTSKWATHPYILCFSHNPDSLYQWRSYTPNGGLCFGISLQELRSKISPDYIYLDNISFSRLHHQHQYGGKMADFTEYLIMGKCLYTDLQQRKMLFEIVTSDKFKTKEGLEDISDDFFIQILSCMFLFKHFSFTEEDEERIILWGPASFKRVEIIGNKPRIPISYYDKNNLNNCIKGVFISPHGNKKQIRIIVQTLLDKYELDNCPVIDSLSTYIG